MSFYDRFLAPGDLRARHSLLNPPATLHKATQTQALTSSITPVDRIPPAARRRRQNALFFGGLAFTLFSAIITRRSLRRKLPPPPSKFSPSNTPAPPVEGTFDAAEALGLATLNTISVFMTALGAGALYWDIADIEDVRDKVRKGVGFDIYGGEYDREGEVNKADREMEEWIADVLSRKDGLGKMKDEIVDRLHVIAQKEEMDKSAKR